MSCILCKESLSDDRKEIASHFLKCGTKTLLQLIDENEDNSKAKSKKRLTNDDEDENETKSKKTKTNANSNVSISPPSISNATPPTTPSVSPKTNMTQQEYDTFLATVKGGRFKRTGNWAGMKQATEHTCTDSECGRTWKPSPAQCLPDDYYCPSCVINVLIFVKKVKVLHHRNNVERFSNPRLVWTKDVPNSFYVFSLEDPTSKKTLYKFGRTQNEDVNKRYPTKEIKEYKMKMLVSIRGRLETMTIIENWWKEQADANGYYSRFSQKGFHGLTECIDVDSKTFDSLLNQTLSVANADPKTSKVVTDIN